MAKHTLFLVHGMGNFPADWWTGVWEQLRTLSGKYRYFETHALEDLVEPVGVTYDQHIRAALARWENEASTFAAFASLNELRLANGLDWLRGITGDEAGFLLSHVADVIIYRFFRLEQERIRDSVKRDVYRHVRDARDGDSSAEFSVVAHSLGTAVIHDALAELAASPEIDGVPNAFQAGNFSFRSIHMLANVSRVLQTEPKAYESVIRPGDRDSRSSYCLRMFGYAHELDPFLMIKPFEPVAWGDMYHAERVRHYRDGNIHSFAHYLDNPRVHIPILRSITMNRAITRREAGRAVDAYPRFGGRFAAVPRVEAKLNEIAALARVLDEEKGLEENFAALLDVWRALGELKALVERQ